MIRTTLLILLSTVTLYGQVIVGVLPFRSWSPEYGIAFADRLTITLFESGEFQVVERRELDRVIDEQNFKLYGLTDDDSGTQIGNLLGAHYIITGTIAQAKQAKSFTIASRMIDVATGEVYRTASFDILYGDFEDVMHDGIKAIANQLAGQPAGRGKIAFRFSLIPAIIIIGVSLVLLKIL